jgi:CBS-domain-containing membrane protein
MIARAESPLAQYEHRVRRIPIVDEEDRAIGIVAQAGLALKDKPERVSKTVAEISNHPAFDCSLTNPRGGRNLAAGFHTCL